MSSVTLPPSDLEGAREIIAALELPATTVLHHLRNLGFIDEGNREGLFERLQIDEALWLQAGSA